MSDPVNSSDEAVEAKFVRREILHQLLKNTEYRAANQLLDDLIAAVRAEAVADERVRAAPAQSAAWYEGYEQGIISAPGRPRSMARNRAWEAAKAEAAKVRLAAGSVPVATPEPEWHNAYDCDAGLADIHPQFVCERPYRVATPPAEPAEQNYRRHLLSLDPSPEVRAALDEAIPAPSQPVTCEHGKTRQHYDFLTGWRCPGPVSVPKESSE